MTGFLEVLTSLQLYLVANRLEAPSRAVESVLVSALFSESASASASPP